MSLRKRLLESQPFSRVLAAELETVARRRQHLRDPAPGGETAPDHAVVVNDVPGSAPQYAALKEIADQKTQRLSALEMPLPTGKGGVVDEEPEPIHHLRSYSSYLAPHSVLFTADTWSLIAIYARNLFINFLILLPATVFIVTLVRLAVLLFRPPNQSFGEWLGVSELSLVLEASLVFLILLSLALNVIGMELYKMQAARHRKKSMPKRPAKVRWLAGQVLAAMVVVVFAVIFWNRDWAMDQAGKKWAVPFFSALTILIHFAQQFRPAGANANFMVLDRRVDGNGQSGP